MLIWYGDRDFVCTYCSFPCGSRTIGTLCPKKYRWYLEYSSDPSSNKSEITYSRLLHRRSYYGTIIVKNRCVNFYTTILLVTTVRSIMSMAYTMSIFEEIYFYEAMYFSISIESKKMIQEEDFFDKKKKKISIYKIL